MKTSCLSEEKDPMGAAISDYFHLGKAGRLKVFSSQFEEDDFPVENLFRTYDEMPELEQVALQMAEGRILDVGEHRYAEFLPASGRGFSWRSGNDLSGRYRAGALLFG